MATPFPYGQRWAPCGNFDYPEEIEQIRQMTVLRDRNVWVIAQGKSTTLAVDVSAGRRDIPLGAVEEIIESKVSTMPDGLARLIQCRAGFLDLARFALEFKRDVVRDSES